MTHEMDIYTSTCVHLDASTYTEGNESARQEPTQKISADTGMSSCHHQLQMTMYVPFIRHTPRLVQVQPTTIPLVN